MSLKKNILPSMVGLVIGFSLSATGWLATDYYQLRQRVNAIELYSIQTRNSMVQLSQQIVASSPPKNRVDIVEQERSKKGEQ